MTISNLAEALESGRFVVTTEIGPPKDCNPGKIREKAELLRGSGVAFNITDNQTAVTRMSSLAGSILLLQMGMEPIMQMTCRDRNRIGLQSDVLGAAALGVRNILCLTGDAPSFGNHPQAKGVFDVDAVQLLHIISDMTGKGVFQSGDRLSGPCPQLCLGAAANPFAEPLELQLMRLEKKVDAGAVFVQTQSIYNLERFTRWLDSVREAGLDRRVRILAGVTPLKSVKMAQRMKFHVPGTDVPDAVYERIVHAADPAEEGYRLAVETIEALREVQGIHGIHITALFWESIIPRLVRETGLVP